jgi:hypothetical protein
MSEEFQEYRNEKRRGRSEEFQAYPNEIEIVQNPTIGAYAIWRFIQSYQDRAGTAPTLALAFLILPILLHKATRDIASSTQKASGLALFAGKLGEVRENLFAIHNRALEYRTLTLESIAIGEQAGLFSIDANTATMTANNSIEREIIPKLPVKIKWLLPVSEKLGDWFSALTDEQVCRTLCVDF